MQYEVGNYWEFRGAVQDMRERRELAVHIDNAFNQLAPAIIDLLATGDDKAAALAPEFAHFCHRFQPVVQRAILARLPKPTRGN